MKRTSIAMLAIVAGVYGCATTESTDSTTPGATSSTPGSQSGGVAPGTAAAGGGRQGRRHSPAPKPGGRT